jgi:hypothetical protein
MDEKFLGEYLNRALHESARLFLEKKQDFFRKNPTIQKESFRIDA